MVLALSKASSIGMPIHPTSDPEELREAPQLIYISFFVTSN